MEDDDLLKKLGADDASDRTVAQRELVSRGEKQRPALLKILLNEEEEKATRIAALGALESFWNIKVQEAFETVLAKGDPDLRRLAADGLGLNAKKGDDAAQTALQKALSDDEPAVRRAAALAMGHLGADGAIEALANMIAFDDRKDTVLFDGYVRALESLGKPGLERLIELSESGVQQELDRAVNVFGMLRTRAGAELLPTMLKNYHLNNPQKAALLRSYDNYLLDPPVSMEPVLTYILAQPKAAPEVTLAALEVLSLNNALKSERAGDMAADAARPEGPSRAFVGVEGHRGYEVDAGGAAPGEVTGRRQPAATRSGKRWSRRCGHSTTRRRRRSCRRSSPIPRRRRNPSNTLRIESLRTLAAIDRPAGTKAARTVLEKYDAPLENVAVEILGDEPDGARFAAKLYLDKKLPRELLPQVIGGVAQACRPARRPVEAAQRGDEERPTRVEHAGGGGAGARAGRDERQSQARPDALSQRQNAGVHQLSSPGGRRRQRRPDLTRLWDTQSIEKIMESISSRARKSRKAIRRIRRRRRRVRPIRD